LRLNGSFDELNFSRELLQEGKLRPVGEGVTTPPYSPSICTPCQMPVTATPDSARLRLATRLRRADAQARRQTQQRGHRERCGDAEIAFFT